jgi:hypothetical protein
MPTAMTTGQILEKMFQVVQRVLIIVTELQINPTAELQQLP